METGTLSKRIDLAALAPEQFACVLDWIYAFSSAVLDGPDRQRLVGFVCNGLEGWIEGATVFVVLDKSEGRIEVASTSLNAAQQRSVREVFAPKDAPWRALQEDMICLPCADVLPVWRMCWIAPVFADADTCAGAIVVARASDAPLTPFQQLALQMGARAFSVGLKSLRQQSHIRYLTEHDALTGLHNEVRLKRDAENLFQMGAPFGLIYVDLDKFQHINDAQGHEVGNEVLVCMARRLERLLINFPGRLYRGRGDEFYIITQVCELDEPQARIQALCKAILEEVAKPVTMNNQVLSLSCSMGISCSEVAQGNYYELLRMADAALGAAKEAGRRTWRFFSEEMVAELSEMLQLETLLIEALEAEDQLDVYYQPILDAKTGRVSTFEALARWKHPERGFIPPFKFIPVAERSGLIRQLDEKVLDIVIQDLQTWQAQLGELCFTVAINLSAIEFEALHIRRMAEKISQCGVASFLEFEMTESMMMEDTQETQALINLLRETGIAALAMDDFGTGYSSLGYLKKFPVDKLKLDQSLVRHIDSDQQDMAIARAVSSLGRSLGLKVVAEGVETEVHRALLEEVGVDLLQGYLFAKPMPGEEVLTWMAEHHISCAGQFTQGETPHKPA